MTADIHLFPYPNPKDLPILAALESDFAGPVFADCPSWRERAIGVSNLVIDSFHRMANRVRDGDDPADPTERELIDFVLLGLHVAIADVIAASDATEPDCEYSARLFALSADPAHRLAARGYAMARNLSFKDFVIDGDLDGLRLLWNTTSLMQPGLDEFYRHLGARKTRTAT